MKQRKAAGKPRDNGRRAARGESSASALLTGTVVAAHGAHVWAEDGDGVQHLCGNRPREERPVCGDRVNWQVTGHRRGKIHSILPRRSELRRPESRKGYRVLAANIDLMLVIAAPKPPPDPFLIDRYLVAAHLLGLDAAVIMNKRDLIDAGNPTATDALLEEYRDLGYTTASCSAHEDGGTAGILKALDGRVGILVGQSGVGKSSLLANLIPDADIRTGELSAASGEGKHTTTTATLYHLPGGGDIIDSPGVRDFKLWDMPPGEVAHGFAEFPSLPPCHFRDCTHREEPGCEVLAALERGEVTPRRYKSYRIMLAQMERMAG